MKLEIRPSNRWCVVEKRTKPTFDSIRADLFQQNVEQGQFVAIGTAIPSRDSTFLRVYQDGNDLLLAILTLNSLVKSAYPMEKNRPETLEIFFDPFHDHLGWFQFIISEDGTHTALTHLPYAEAHSTAFPEIRLKSVKTHTEKLSGTYSSWDCRLTFVRFDRKNFFPRGNTCGFNVNRYRPFLNETTSWNLALGNGFQDATAFGHLHQAPPVLELQEVSANLNGTTLHIQGQAKGSHRAFTLEVADPLDRRVSAQCGISNGKWETKIKLKGLIAGRYRLYPTIDGQAIEPVSLYFETLPQTRQRPFCVSITNDVPMTIIPNYYTPARLHQEMATIAKWGFQRVHWIEYGDWPSFWQRPEFWQANYNASIKHCGDLLKCAAKQAHANGLEFIADLKIFDLAENSYFCNGYPKSQTSDLEQRPYSVIPEIAAHPECAMQANPEWLLGKSLPVKLKVYSETEIPKLRASDIRLWVSDDNRDYQPYRGKFSFSQGSLQRPHQRWTPAGNITDKGHQRNWFIELNDLTIKHPYLSIEIVRPGVNFQHRPFMLIETQNDAGTAVPITLAAEGSHTQGFIFWKQWASWANLTEPILRRRLWDGRNLGMVFQESPNMPALLEPAHKGTHQLWLERIRRIIVAGADGVGLRTLCHHNGHISYLKYAFAPCVREEFQSLYGRSPRTTPEDYERIRRIRGERFTQFLRDARKLTLRSNKKFAFQLEAGVEVPPHLDIRMQFHLDYETWLKEKLFDEVSLKWFTSQNPFIHERILPLARRQGIPVHVISPCLEGGLDHRGVESAEAFVTRAYKAGFDGFNFYETANLIEMNPLGVPTPKGFTAPAIAKAMQALDALRTK